MEIIRNLRRVRMKIVVKNVEESEEGGERIEGQVDVERKD